MKRFIDVVFSACALIALSPFLVLVGLAIRITMGPPVLFRQMRPGRHGQPFVIYKFRSMTFQSDSEGNLVPARERLTRLGFWLRLSSFDEVPELWNVLIGDMSLVGPRPLLMKYLPLYSDEQMRRHQVRPGLTGLAQVKGRHELDWERRFVLDNWYVDHLSLRLDVAIMRETLAVLFDGQADFEPGSEPDPFSGSRPAEDLEGLAGDAASPATTKDLRQPSAKPGANLPTRLGTPSR